MLKFFDKYQRSIFLVVTVMIISSFAFFGTFDTFSNAGAHRVEDREVGRSVDGSKIMNSEVLALSRFLSSDVGDVLGGARGVPNLCNDGVIRNDLLQTGLGEMVVAAYFEACESSLKEKLEKVKKYRGYEHPSSSMISVRSVWDRFMPAIGGEISSLQHQDRASVATFSHLAHLYQMQMLCPPEFVRRVLAHDQRQASWVEKDPSLQYIDLSPMGFHSVSDWFGPECIDVFSQFIINGARYAETKGYSVSLEEAKGDLLHNFQTAIARLSHIQGISSLSFARHLQSMGLDEKTAVASWRSVLLFRRYFQEIGGAVFQDRLPYRDFASFACESARVEKYEWPQEFHFSSLQDLIEFQVYLKGLGGDIAQVSFPRTVLSPNMIAKQFPDLLHTTYRMKVSTVSLNEIALRVTTKEILDWELNGDNWKKLGTVFSFLENGETRESRFECLEKLSSSQRGKIDLYVRKSIAKEHPEWISEDLTRAQGVERDVSVGTEWLSLSGIKAVERFKALLNIPSFDIDEYSEDGETFYRFESIEEIAPPHILTFKEAKELGVMTWLADRFMQAEYEKIRIKSPQHFQVGGEWKLFSSVKEDVARIVLRDLFHAIGGENKPLAYYASHRLELPAKEALFDLQYGVEREEFSDPILKQFRCVPHKMVFQKTTKDEWVKEQLEKVDIGGWSSIHVPEDGNISFFCLEGKEISSEPALEQLALGKEKISADAQRYAARALLSLMKQKKPPANIQKDEK